MKNKREKIKITKAEKEEEEHLPVLLETWNVRSSTGASEQILTRHSLSDARCVSSHVDAHRFDATGTCHCGRDGAADPTRDDQDGATDDRDALAGDVDDAAYRNVANNGKA
jgi:hypothetical protein